MERKEGKRRGRHKTYYMEEKTGKGVRKGRNDQRCLLSALHCELAGRLPFLSTTINHEANTRERTKLSVSSFLLSTMNSGHSLSSTAFSHEADTNMTYLSRQPQSTTRHGPSQCN